MKILFAVAALGLLSPAAADEGDGMLAKLSLPRIATMEGKDAKSYREVDFTKWSRTGISFTHKDGVSTVTWDQLPDNVVAGLKKRGVPVTRVVEKSANAPPGGEFATTLATAAPALARMGFAVKRKELEGDVWLEAKSASNWMTCWPIVGTKAMPVDGRRLHKVQFQTTNIPVPAEECIKALGDAAECAGKHRSMIEEWARVVGFDAALQKKQLHRFETEIDGMYAFLAVNPGVVFIGHVEAMPALTIKR